MSKYCLTSTDISTYVDLYTFLQSFETNDIKEWLSVNWKGKDKQESLFRLFASLQCIQKINTFDICKGNFNLQTIQKIVCSKEIFYNSLTNKPLYLKDKGDSSDLTGIHKKDNKHLLVTTSKNINNDLIGNLDIEKIVTNFEDYKKNGYTSTLCIVVRDRKNLQLKVQQSEKSNHKVKSLITDPSTIIIDWDDLNEAFFTFKRIYSTSSIQQLCNNSSEKAPILLKFHQLLSIQKTMSLKKNNQKVLWGHIPRSGKSYIIAGTIIEDSKKKSKCNYLIITTAPNETILQYMNVFNCLQLTDFNVISVNGSNKAPALKDKNIIICSKQFLQTKIDEEKVEEKEEQKVKEKVKVLKWLKDCTIDIRFIDESHFGGTTTLAQKVLQFYAPNSFTVQITATYLKPIKEFDIPSNCWILWDLEDIKCCKTIDNEESKQLLMLKHNHTETSNEVQTLLSNYSSENIKNEYQKYPELWILTDMIKPEVITEIQKETTDNNYGWSPDACFLLKQNKNGTTNEFQNVEENCKLWYRIFGKYSRLGIPDKNYPENSVFLKRIETICKNPSINSRYIGNMDNEPMIIMAFLPQHDIDNVSNATKELLLLYNIVPNFEIVIINSKAVGSKAKETIENARIKAKNGSKKGVLVLTGKQCSLGVTIENCDIVLLLNNNTSFDFIYQAMFRCMSEANNKKCGFVVDLNLNRVINTSIIEYSSIVKPNLHPKEAIKYILQSKCINLNSDHWKPMFKNVTNLNNLNQNDWDECNENLALNDFSETIYNIYTANTEKALSYFLNRLNFKQILLSTNEQKIINSIFLNASKSKSKSDTKIKDGIEKVTTSVSDSESETKSNNNSDNSESESDNNSETEGESENKVKQVNYMQILKHMIPLICLLTIHTNEITFIEMYTRLEQNQSLCNIFLEQVKSWWNKNIDLKMIKQFITIYIKYMSSNKEINQIITTIKELFIKAKHNYNELSSLIDTYLIPQEIEKKDNAEFSTPYKLRQDMINKIPTEFWSNPNHKVFEPCSGKGGFLVDILNRFDHGLKDIITDSEERYKHIVENCIYFSDINATNIYVCKLLLNPNEKYTLHYNEGDTLNCDITKKWNLTHFDAIIGNPPFQNKQISKGKRGGGDLLWNKFVVKSLQETKENGYLVFVHPSGWRKPESENSKYNGLYKLMTNDNQMLYLEIHSTEDGIKVFKCGTRYDWYIIQKVQRFKNTIVKDEDGKVIEIDTAKWAFLPNKMFDTIYKCLSTNPNDTALRCNILFSRSNYGSDKKWVQATKNTEFKYPLIHSTPQKGVRYLYSSKNTNGHFGVPKVIFGETGIYNSIIDFKGEYGMTQGTMGIPIESEKEGNDIKLCIESEIFKQMMNACSWSNYRIDWRLFTYFKKNFWVSINTDQN
jgi:hypothetical protein